MARLAANLKRAVVHLFLPRSSKRDRAHFDIFGLVREEWILLYKYQSHISELIFLSCAHWSCLPCRSRVWRWNGTVRAALLCLLQQSGSTNKST